MRVRLLFIISIISFILLTCVIAYMPYENVPIHYDINGAVDSYGSKWKYLIFAAVPVIIMSVYSAYRKRNHSNNKKIEDKIVPIIALVFIAIGWIFIMLPMLKGVNLSIVPSVVIIWLGLLIIYISSMMPGLEQNRTFGIKLPWTIKDNVVWERTHKIGATWGMIGGAIIIAFAVMGVILDNTIISVIGVIAGISLLVLVPTIFAYRLYKIRHF